MIQSVVFEVTAGGSGAPGVNHIYWQLAKEVKTFTLCAVNHVLQDVIKYTQYCQTMGRDTSRHILVLYSLSKIYPLLRLELVKHCQHETKAKIRLRPGT